MKNSFAIFVMFFAISAAAQVEPYYAEPYEDVVTKHFVLHQEYPKEAELYGLDGGIIVQVQISQMGKLLGYKFLKKSDYDVLNDAVMRMVIESQPYPQVPTSYLNDSYFAEFIFPVVFGDDKKMLLNVDKIFQVEVKKARNEK